MSYLFLILVLLFCGINNYLAFFANNGKLPAPMGFNVFAVFAHLAILVMSIWYLGWLFGIIFFVLYILNILDAGISWIIRYMLLNKYFSKQEAPQLSTSIYSFFSFFVFGIIIFTIISFFASEFMSFKYLIEHNDYEFLIYFGIVFVVGFVLRTILIKVKK